MLLIAMDRPNAYNEAIQVLDGLRDHNYIQKFKYPEVLSFEDVLKRKKAILESVSAMVEVYDNWGVHICDDATMHHRLDNEMIVFLAQRAGSLYLADCVFPENAETFSKDMQTGYVFSLEASHHPVTETR